MGRYLAMIPDHIDGDQTWRQPLKTLAVSLGFRHLDHSQFALIAQAGPLEIGLASGCDGAVIGTLFRRSDHSSVAQLTERERQAVMTTGGGALIQHYWGNF